MVLKCVGCIRSDGWHWLDLGTRSLAITDKVGSDKLSFDWPIRGRLYSNKLFECTVC